jgi:glycosyltransferase involved in cell wall biosynthesis
LKLSIVTVNFNNYFGLIDTLNSLKKFDKNLFELIVVDGLSTDNSLDACTSNKDIIDILISETDKGIFDAMNKGIELSNCDWIYFLNSGDMLIDHEFFTKIKPLIFSEFGVIYGDVLHERNNKDYLLKCNHNSRILNHQALIYKKELHSIYGLYSLNSFIKISDYYFLAQIPDSKFIKINSIVSKAQPGGTSEKLNILQLRNRVDFFIGKVGFIRFLWSSIINYLWFHIRVLFR